LSIIAFFIFSTGDVVGSQSLAWMSAPRTFLGMVNLARIEFDRDSVVPDKPLTAVAFRLMGKC
jgi:hypothetical protein